MNKRNLPLALVAGLAGGFISTYLSPQRVHAESQVPPEIRAQCFSLVNQDGVTLGTFSLDKLGRPTIVLRDKTGREAWTATADRDWTSHRLHPK